MSADTSQDSGSSVSAVDARGLEFSYGENRALDGVSFSIDAAEIYGFLGPNGGGKSTLFRLLATLLVPQGGSAAVFGQDVVSKSTAVRNLLGVVFQSPSVDTFLRVEENLLHHGHLYGLRGAELARRIELALERFRLTSRRRELVKTLSGGLKRRVELAKSLLHEPRVLLLDEPSTGLDPGARRDLWALLEDLRIDTGATIVLTTHYMEEGERCDRVALINEGKIAVEGRPSDLREEIGGDVVILTARDAESLGAGIRERFGIEPALHEDQVRFEHENGHQFVATLVEEFPDEVEAVTVAKPSLEDVFLRRTGHRLWVEVSE